MANDGIDRGSITPHVQTYEGVMALMKWGTVASMVIAAFVIWLIAA